MCVDVGVLEKEGGGGGGGGGACPIVTFSYTCPKTFGHDYLKNVEILNEGNCLEICCEYATIKQGKVRGVQLRLIKCN